MDLVERVKERLDPERKSAMDQWYAWIDQAAQDAANKIRQQIAFELGHIPEPLLMGIKATISNSLRAAGRYIISSKLAEPLKAETKPDNPAPPEEQSDTHTNQVLPAQE